MNAFKKMVFESIAEQRQTAAKVVEVSKRPATEVLSASGQSLIATSWCVLKGKHIKVPT